MFFEDFDEDYPEVENESDWDTQFLYEPDDPGEETDGFEEDNDDEQDGTISFTGNGFDCSCSGKCLCRYYEPKSTYNSDCAYCGHGLHWHRRR